MADDIKELPAYEANLLVPFKGEKPPAPNWFNKAVSTPHEEHFIEVEGTTVRYQSWGEKERPGLLLVHGNGAHAHWYDFIAPFFADTHHVVAMTFGGMGDSGWRERYNVSTFTAEQMAVCEAAGLFDGPGKPTIIAHSFGGFITIHTAALHSDHFDGIVIIDSPIRPPEDDWDGPPERGTKLRLYPDLTSALARFRLAPSQSCENFYIVDYIARHSLKQTQTESGETGWQWKFDPFIWRRFDAMDPASELIQKITCKVSLMRGENSVLIPERIWSYMASLRPDAMMVSIPEAQHHVMLDQPLALISALRAQLAAWNG